MIFKDKALQLGYIALLCTVAFSIQAAYSKGVDNASMVAAHNKWRAKAGVKEQLTYSSELAIKAQTWADHLKLTNACKMRHSAADGKFGENLYWASALEWSDARSELQDVPPERVVDSWG